MGGATFGYVIGGFFADILVPVLILIVSNFIPVAERNPKVVYGICGLLVVAASLVSMQGGGQVALSAVSGALALAFIYWGYTRAAKKLSSPTDTPST